jgi:DNA/RNA endonuclease YhcR with UshA esterase domain
MNKIFITLASSLFILSGCMKDNIDPPANPKDPNIAANYTIYDLKQDFKASGKTIWTIEQDKVIEAIVSANDIGGNLYEEIVIQDKDNRAAIGVQINRSNLYNDFPVGRKVFIKVQGMAMSIENNLVKLGGYIDTTTVPGAKSLGQLPPTAIDKTLLKGSIGNEVKIDQISLNQLSEAYHYKLVRFKDVEFKCEDTKLTYADAINLKDANRTLLDNSGNDVIVRTSGYSNFAASKVASGKGELTGIFTVYRNDFQMILRDINDVKLNDTNRTTPCAGSGGGGGGGGGTATLATIASIRAMYAGNGVKIADKYIEGVVISDKDGKNINSQNLAIQDATGGIIIRFSSAHSYAMGDKLKVTFVGDSLTKFAGLMQMFVSSSAVSKIGTGTITPATVTIATINNNIDAYESTLVKILAASFSAAGTYSGSKTLADASSNITHYTASSATFSGSALPSGSKTFTAIVGRFNSTKQVSIRNLTDVE